MATSRSLEALTRDQREEQAREIALLDRARAAIDEATSIAEVKDTMDRAEALRLYAKRAQYGRDLQAKCAEIRIRAERRAGEMLREEVRHEGGRRAEGDDSPTLSDLGVSKDQSSRWQRIATVPDQDFERVIEERGADLSTADLLRAANGNGNGKAAPADEQIGGTAETLVVDATSGPAPVSRAAEEAAQDATCFVWVTNQTLPAALAALGRLGFDYRTTLTWVGGSDLPGGSHFRNDTEHFVVATRGHRPARRLDLGTVVRADDRRGAASAIGEIAGGDALWL